MLRDGPEGWDWDWELGGRLERKGIHTHTHTHTHTHRVMADSCYMAETTQHCKAIFLQFKNNQSETDGPCVIG